MKPAVSVIIPAYKSALTIGRTIDSLQQQTRRDWEAIIACDGPTDNTLEIARRAAAIDARIHVLSLPHRGVSRARNAAIERSAADWLLFLDADDTIAPGYFAHMLRVARSRPLADVIACGYNRIDDLGRTSSRYRPLPLDRDALAVCVAGPPGAIHSFLVTRDQVLAAGAFDETLCTNEDWDLWLRLAARGAKFTVTRARLANYWSTPNSLSRSSQQMVRDAGVVQLRAQERRVVPRRGLESFDRRDATFDELQLRNAMWSAGVAIGQSRPVPDLFRDISPDVEHRHQKLHLVAKLLDGLVVGTGTGYSALALRWPAIKEGVDEFLRDLGAFLGESDMRPLAQALQVEVARAGRYRVPIDFGYVVGVPLSLAMLWRGYVPQTSADKIVFRAYWLRPATMFSFAAPLTGPLTGKDVRAVVRRGVVRRIGDRLSRRPRAMKVTAKAVHIVALGRRLVGLRRDEPPHVPVLSSDRLLAQQIVAEFSLPPEPEQPKSSLQVAGHPGAGSSATEWDRFFETENPWNYESDYERIKYERTLALLKPVPEGAALEIACAEGHFTVRLATIVASVCAVDISQRAIERAQERARALPHVRFDQRDIFERGIEGNWDIITCSEMLYFASSIGALETVAARIAAALLPGGQFVHAHAFKVGDSPDRTAFDWDLGIGAETIFKVFARTTGLRHENSILTDLYRIDRFVADTPRGKITPVVEHIGLDCELEPEVAANVIWNGPIRLRADVARARTFRLPVLFYQSMVDVECEERKPDHIGADQLEAQLRFLRRRGYHSINPDQWKRDAARNGVLRGRPVLLTFDRIDRVFVDQVWPIIRRNGFSAHIFVTPDELVALEAGDGRGTITAMIGEGATFGSRLTDIAGDLLSSADLLIAALWSRHEIGRAVGANVTSVAVPDGMSDTRIETLLAAAGYDRLFLNDGDIAWVCGQEMATPRYEVTPDLKIADFATAIGATEPPEPGEECNDTDMNP